MPISHVPVCTLAMKLATTVEKQVQNEELNILMVPIPLLEPIPMAESAPWWNRLQFWLFGLISNSDSDSTIPLKIGIPPLLLVIVLLGDLILVNKPLIGGQRH